MFDVQARAKADRCEKRPAFVFVKCAEAGPSSREAESSRVVCWARPFFDLFGREGNFGKIEIKVGCV